ncbi:MAG: alpha-D-glucose phosphate-specific phosphoglucomutase [Desulfovibrionaceae bacterium]|nr:alpha-D-glucose phosphate-specific phosphoglucomutase [Desulfovibrionaceae bacterium]
MTLSDLAGKPAPRSLLANIPRLVSAFYTGRPDPSDPGQLVSFGTSGHRGSSLRLSFNEAHVLAISQAICEHRAAMGVTGPLFMGMDTHALSEPALAAACEVMAANHVELVLQKGLTPTPTPVVSHAILTHNRKAGSNMADGVVVTPSHNPPEDGGFKYNPPNGGPADTKTTKAIQDRANELLRRGLGEVRRLPLDRALKAPTTHWRDYVGPYVSDLGDILDLEAVAGSGLRIGADPLGGSGLGFWEPIAERYGLDIEVVNKTLDPTFSFMPVDHDGTIRMDCSSPFAMAGLIRHKQNFDIAFGNDPDFDRHGIVTRSGLMNPNHFLAAAADYLFSTRPGWGPKPALGKTLVTSSMLDRVAEGLGREVFETPVGFKWFVDGLISGALGMGCEESAGASFLRKDGTVWTTDKDGLIMGLLAAEMTAVRGRDPALLYSELTERYGDPIYQRLDVPAGPTQRAAFRALSPESLACRDLAGEPVRAVLANAPGNGQPIGGIKVAADNGWFAARPSGTEDIYKIYAESFVGPEHLKAIQDQAREMLAAAFAAAGA